MEFKTDAVLDLRGNAIFNASVRVLNEDRTLATVFDSSGAQVNNPVATDATGEFSAAVANGKYFFEISVAGKVYETRGPISFFDAMDGGAATLGFQQAGTGAVQRTVQDELRDRVSVKQFGAVGDGVTDDAAAIQAAVTDLGPSGTVFFPPGNYKTTASILVSKNIVLQGAGPKASIVRPVGNFDVFSFTGPSEGAGVRDLGIAGSSMTGGALIAFRGSDRGSVSNIIATSPFNGIFATKVNVLSLSEVWVNGIRGEFGVQIYGDATNRSDVIDMDNVIQSCSDNAVGATGILIDGNVHTVDIRHAACTKMGRGLWVKNTSGALNPAFITGYDIQVDFPLNEAVRLEGSARTILLTDLYAHGSVQADGIYIDASVQNVSIQGGQCDSNYKRGIFAGGRYIKVSSQQVSNNSAQGSAAWPGIEIGTASVGVSIVGNLSGQWLGYAANLQSYGVQIAAGAQAYVVTSNNLRLNVTGEFLDAANATDSVVAGNTTTLGKYAFSRGICSYAGDFPVSAQGGGRMVLANGNGTHLEVGGATANVVNRLRIAGDAAGGVPKILAEGDDPNLDIQLLTKGSGVPRFGAYSSNGDAAITGYITIKDASGTLRKLAIIT